MLGLFICGKINNEKGAKGVKKLSVPLAFVLAAALLLTACGRKGPVPPPDQTTPTVSSTIPSNGSVDVPVDLPGGISITFSKIMDASTINDQTVILADGQNSVPGSVMYTDISGVSTAVFTPSSTLNPTTLYKVTVDADIQDIYGIRMGVPYISSFNTGTVPDTMPPTIVATTPKNGDIGVMPNAALSVTFSEPVDPQTISFLLSTGSTTIPCTMSYYGTTAIFTPLSILASNTTYTATVSAGVKDLAGNAMPHDYSWGFKTSDAPDITPPAVIATAPRAGATDVAINIAPSVTFSEPVDQQTISFLLSTGSTTIPCTMSYSGTTAIFTPLATLAYSTLYTATVSAGVKDLAGNAMPNSYIWSFVTSAAPDITPPVVIATTPLAGANDVAINIAPSVTFSEPVDQKTISFLLSTSTGSTAVPCTMSYSGTTAIFTPLATLAYSTPYTATVSAGVKDLAGNAMPNSYIWSFVTSAAPDITPPAVIATTPRAGATGVAINIAPSITFSEPVDQQTISFLLSAGSTTVPCTMSYSGTTVIFTPLATLADSTSYTATVSAGVKDLAGNAMTSSYSWSFMTGTGFDTTPPIISAVTPTAGATGVAANVAPTVTFSEPVDSTTITFTLKDSKGAILGYTMSYSGTTAVFTPSPKLKPNTNYTARVSAGVKDLAGNAMLSDYSWSFKTK
jgi:predicted small lipoprotein YifL